MLPGSSASLVLDESLQLLLLHHLGNLLCWEGFGCMLQCLDSAKRLAKVYYLKIITGDELLCGPRSCAILEKYLGEIKWTPMFQSFTLKNLVETKIVLGKLGI